MESTRALSGVARGGGSGGLQVDSNSDEQRLEDERSDPRRRPRSARLPHRRRPPVAPPFVAGAPDTARQTAANSDDAPSRHPRPRHAHCIAVIADPRYVFQSEAAFEPDLVRTMGSFGGAETCSSSA